MRKRMAVLALVAVAIAVIAAGILTVIRGDSDSGRNLCGTEATGPFAGNSIFEHDRKFQWGTYKTLEEARAGTGLPILDVTAPGWSFAGADAASGDIPDAVGVTYACRRTNGTNIRVISFPAEFESLRKQPFPAKAGDRNVGLLRTDYGGILVVWEENGRAYTATAIPGPGFGEMEILEVIGSLE